MKITVSNGNHFNVSIDDDNKIDFTDNAVNINSLESTITSGYIGIRTIKSNSHSKSLFISGGVYEMNNNNIINQYTTCQPTTAPTSSPTAVKAYHVINITKNWTEAESYCQQVCNSNLASIHSDFDMTVLSNVLDNYFGDGDRIWIGLHEKSIEGIWEWTDGTAWDYGNNISVWAIYPWWTHSPDDFEGQDCAQIIRDSPDQWNDDQCTDVFPFVCNDCITTTILPTAMPSTPYPSIVPTTSTPTDAMPSTYPTYTPSNPPTQTPTISIANITYYYISTSRFSYDVSRTFCQDICHSELASIHSSDDMEVSMYLAFNAPRFEDTLYNGNDWEAANNVRTGLHVNSNSVTLSWIDGTDFDYGYASTTTNYKGGIYPWADNPPQPDDLLYDNDEICVSMRKSNDYGWGDYDNYCTDRQRFICNSCDGELMKYAVIHDSESLSTRNYAASETYCNTYLNTSLASIHSQYDFDLAQKICELTNSGSIGADCWIGLDEIGRNSLDYKWTDGTEFDFGTNVDDSSIWYNARNYGDCVDIENYNYHFTWEVDDCSEGKYAMCAMPSLLCYPSYWNISVGDYLWDIQCETYSNGADTENMLVSNVQWINYNGKFVIEYIFKFTSVEMGYNGSAGIVFFNGVCNFYYVEIVQEMNRVVLGRQVNGNVDILDFKDIFNVQLDTYYVLKVTVINGTDFTISVNDAVYVTYIDSSVASNGGKILSGFVGIRNNYTNIHGKSLYGSGGLYFMNNDYIIQTYAQCITPNPTSNPTSMPTTNIPTNPPTTNKPTTNKPTTNIPTLNPTLNPTFNPTVNPTVYPTVNPTVYPTIYPTVYPTTNPTKYPTNIPTADPSSDPTVNPTINPTDSPTKGGIEEITDPPTTTQKQPTATTPAPILSVALESTASNQDGSVDVITTTKSNINDEIEREKQRESEEFGYFLYIGIGVIGFCICCFCCMLIIRLITKKEDDDIKPMRARKGTKGIIARKSLVLSAEKQEKENIPRLSYGGYIDNDEDPTLQEATIKHEPNTTEMANFSITCNIGQSLDPQSLQNIGMQQFGDIGDINNGDHVFEGKDSFKMRSATITAGGDLNDDNYRGTPADDDDDDGTGTGTNDNNNNKDNTPPTHDDDNDDNDVINIVLYKHEYQGTNHGNIGRDEFIINGDDHHIHVDDINNNNNNNNGGTVKRLDSDINVSTTPQ